MQWMPSRGGEKFQNTLNILFTEKKRRGGCVFVKKKQHGVRVVGGSTCKCFGTRKFASHEPVTRSPFTHTANNCVEAYFLLLHLCTASENKSCFCIL